MTAAALILALPGILIACILVCLAVVPRMVRRLERMRPHDLGHGERRKRTVAIDRNAN